MAFLEAAVHGSVEHVTLYDLTGPRGLALAQTDRAGPAGLPVLWLLAQLRDAGNAAVSSLSGGAGSCAALAMQGASGHRTLVANLRDEITDVRLRVDASHATVRMLDELTLAGADVLAGRELAGARYPIAAGWLPLLLRPYAVACVDTS